MKQLKRLYLSLPSFSLSAMFLFCAAPFFLMDDVSVRSDLAESGAATAYQAAGLLLFFLLLYSGASNANPQKDRT
ncbi:hypothetical protein [Rhodopirellula europaea]|nr:hypothetical protein [Rhodopirellula europaea]